jgi:hypothetical protein
MSIFIGKTAKIIASLERSGEPVTANITMVETTGHGTLAWKTQVTGNVTVNNEEVDVINNIVNQSQCVLAVTPSSVVGIYAIDTNGHPVGSNLVIMLTTYGRTIDLNVQLATGTKLLATYTKGGSVENYLLGVSLGMAQVIVSANVGLEKGLSQTVEVAVETKSVPDTPSPPNPSSASFSVSGPGVLQWYRSGYWYNDGWASVPYSGGIEVWYLSLGQWGVVCNSDPIVSDSVQINARGLTCSVFHKLASYPGVAPTFGIGSNPGTITITLDYTWHNRATARYETATISKDVIINPG